MNTEKPFLHFAVTSYGNLGDPHRPGQEMISHRQFWLAMLQVARNYLPTHQVIMYVLGDRESGTGETESQGTIRELRTNYAAALEGVVVSEQARVGVYGAAGICRFVGDLIKGCDSDDDLVILGVDEARAPKNAHLLAIAVDGYVRPGTGRATHMREQHITAAPREVGDKNSEAQAIADEYDWVCREVRSDLELDREIEREFREHGPKS